MAESYRINSGCTFAPPPPAAPIKIYMPVTPINSPPTPIVQIVGRQGTSTSWEREAIPRYADIYFTTLQFSMLLQNVNTATTVYVTYDAAAIAGDDQIIHQRVTFNYP